MAELKPLLAFDLGLRLGDLAFGAALSLEPGETVVLTGPSGAGKTSLLRALAGHLRPERGHIRCGGELVYGEGADLPPWRRPLAHCPQGDTLFPHLDVAGNLAFGLKSAQGRLEPWIEAFGLGYLLKRRPRDLSGGQRQRVQLARTLALEAPVLLLDEPFGALDPETHATVREALRRHLAAAGRATLLVSHTPGDAEALGAHEARLEAGWMAFSARP